MSPRELNNRPLYLELADRIEARLKENNWDRLPSAHSIAKELGSSRPTVLKALRILADRGILTLRQGSPTRVGGSLFLTNPEPTPTSPYDDLKLAILHGVYPSGSALPKLAYLATRYHVSHHTITNLYRRLASEGLANRIGRSWVAGPTGASGFGSASPGVILILSTHLNSWPSVHTNQRTIGFAATFSKEAEIRGIRLEPALVDTEVSTSLSLNGWAAVSMETQKLGSRFLGSLVLMQKRFGSSPAQTVSRALELGRPVVWFDRYNEGTEDLPVSPLFARCHFSEEAALELCMAHLIKLGHRRIGFAAKILRPSDAWKLERAAKLAKIARQKGVDFETVEMPSLPLEDIVADSAGLARRLGSPLPPSLQKAIHLIRRRRGDSALLLEPREQRYQQLEHFLTPKQAGPPNLKAQLENAITLLTYAPLLLPLLQKGATALVCANDYDALRYAHWMRAANIRVPEDLSLLSFDNYIRHLPFHISTIDFGFEGLGYRAFHRLLGDIPVAPGAEGVSTQPHIVDRGSTAPPRVSNEPVASILS